MTTKELLENYVELCNDNCLDSYGREVAGRYSFNQNMKEVLIKELEASIRKEIYKELSASLPTSQLVADIRKEVVEEIWKVIKDTDGSVGLRSVEIIKEVKEHALLKGITLK